MAQDLAFQPGYPNFSKKASDHSSSTGQKHLLVLAPVIEDSDADVSPSSGFQICHAGTCCQAA